MDVEIVSFPQTRVALITHLGPPQNEHATVKKLVAWKLEKGFLDQTKYRSYGLHYSDPRTCHPTAYRVDFCLSIDGDVGANPFGIVDGFIPGRRCAYARDVGSRLNNKAAAYLFDHWLPESKEKASGEPMIFHYVNVGPNVLESEAVTDVYLPLLWS